MGSEKTLRGPQCTHRPDAASPRLWRFVFNTNLGHWALNDALQTAAACGYLYLVWNGRVYTAPEWDDTGVLEADLT